MDKPRVLTEFARVINSDRYQYTQSDIFLMEKMEEKIAVFDVFFRKTADGGFAVVAGVQEVINLIEILNSTSEEEKREYFSKLIESKQLVDYLSKMKFTGDIYALRDGEIAYPNEPVISIKAPLIQAQILETPILNIINMQMAIATKASRVTRAAYPVPVSAFGSRRAHGFDSAVAGNKAAVIGGCSSHSNLVTEYKYGIASVGTMAHSYIQAFGVGSAAEKQAFETFIKHRVSRKGNTLVLLIDTYNTLGMGIHNAIEAFKECGIDDYYKGIYGVRIDSGDLAYLSKKCRALLDEAGFKKAKIFLTNSLNEEVIRSLKEQGACVDIYGVGDEIAVSKSNPCFGGVYKIVEIDEHPVIKLSEDVIKISNPGFKEVYRIYDKSGLAYADLITLVKSDKDKELLIHGKELVIRDEKYDFKFSVLKENEYTIKKLTRQYVKNGEIILSEYEKLFDIMGSQKYYKENLAKISEERKRLENPHKYKVDLSTDLVNLKYSLIKSIKSEIG
ncbi:nicotinate phosphoribosyltransferase [uncultured Fusobacterium sp.]|uniref:nicotinate phosphoribosyltransferase n=1 Tax=uncultured Fusobacterium sp. TaxID=159267 RepID=UPI002586BB5A|nr:nicotinate phosphoribosyltransferase [uncultured Fusobacterium sp.]